MSTLAVTLIQTGLSWEEPAANREHFESRLANVQTRVDLVVLPEMFSTGFSMNSSALAEDMEGPTVNWMQQMAHQLESSICGSVIIEADGHYYNRFLMVRPDDSILHYDKRHLFRMSTENENYSPGTTRQCWAIGNANVFPQVCYDLRFPVFSRNDVGFDVMIYVANWPAPRRHHWKSLLVARAVENQSYVIGLNRIGTDGNDVSYAGDSAVIDFNGETIASLDDRDENVTVSLDLTALASYRESFPAWKDADPFSLDH